MNGFFSHMQQEQQAFMRQILQEQRDFVEEMQRRQQREDILISGRSTPLRLEQTSPDVEISEPNIRRVNRRDSAVNRLTTFQSNSREGLLTLESDKHMNIRWEIRSVDAFLKFFEEIDRFTLSFNQPVPYLFTHISENLQEVIAELLYVNKPQKYSTKMDTFKATTQDIYEMAQIFFAPRDLAHFNMLLTTACKKYEVIQKGEHYSPTKLKLYGLRQKFRERFEFLSEGATKAGRRDAIPAINYKQGGLLNVWTDLTPEGSRDPFKQMLINAKFDSLDEFFEKYFAKVDETNVLSENIKVYKYRVGIFQHTQSSSQRPTYNTSKKERLHQIEDEMNQIPDYMDDEEDQVYSMEKSREDFSNQACSKLVVVGTCWNRDCRYSHNPNVVEKQKEQLLRKWSDEKATKTKPQMTPDKLATPPAVNQRQPSSSGQQPGQHRINMDKKSSLRPQQQQVERPTPRLRAIDDADSELEEEETLDPDLFVVSAVFKMDSERKYQTVSHREGEARLPDTEEPFRIDGALFDTGASGDNYISEELVRKNHLEGQLQPVNKSVKVANGSYVQIVSRIQLEVTFWDNEGLPVVALLFFNVLQGLSVGMVIGLPAICGNFLHLFTEMLNTAPLNMIDPTILSGEPIPLNWESPICEETNMIPEAESYPDIRFLEDSYESSLQKFLEELPSRICPAFNVATPVFDYLCREARDVFVPASWDGIQGIDPIRLEFDPSMPQRLKPALRRIPAAVLEPAKREFDRMCQYMYEPSSSPIASPIVVAPKATPPYVRLCGDYRAVNKYVKSFHFPIPDVIKELHKAAGFTCFIDLDVKNAFHGIRIHEETSRILSVQTPYGQYQPKFLPEGVAPASAVLMSVMSQIFADYHEWMIVIFDNILVLALNYDDAFDKLVKVISRCKERNVVLKLSKSRFGYGSVEFFGYLCTNGSYSLSEERIKEVTSIPFPSGKNRTKQMQQFLGAAMYFKPFIYGFSEKTARLNDMVAKQFDWSEDSWRRDYRGIFEAFKRDILHAYTLYHPDYSLPWYLYVDASDVACGGVLIQLTSDSVQQVIAFVSKKFTATATRWSTIEKEAFAMFYSVQKLQYYLFLKRFTMLTDHNNLLWIESSVVPKIVRIRIYLQNFQFDVIHVKGKHNVFADWLSRMYPETVTYSEEILAISDVVDDVEMDPVDSVIMKVHNSRMGHHGVQRTWLLLNKHFPGHSIPIRVIQDFVSKCVWCQKIRSTLNQSIAAPVRAIVPEHPRQYCGYDTLYVTPPDQDGNQYLHVFKLIPSRLVGLYPSKDLTAESLATAMFLFFTTYGMVDVLITDPGSNINSEVVRTLLQWSGIRLRMSIVGRHESNMVERSHRETIRFLSTLINEERLKNVWSKPHIIATVQFILNSEISKETSISPYEYTFGTNDASYFRLPEAIDPTMAPVHLRRLNQDLVIVRQVAKEVQEGHQQKRRDQVPEAGSNSYQLGDMVLIDELRMGQKKDKLTSRFSGPYVISKVYKADLTCRHIVTGRVREVHMDSVKPFFGNSGDAFKAAMTDDDQFIIREVKAYRGDPELRSGMQFEVLFADGDCLWLPYNQDLTSTKSFAEFCGTRSELLPLLYTLAEWKKQKSHINAQGVKGVQPGEECFVDLRAWGSAYYESIDLPDMFHRNYVVPCRYVKWTNSKKTKIDVRCELFNQLFEWTAVDVQAYGSRGNLSDEVVLIDEDFVRRYPQLMEG